jgi:hypothetical protein
MKAEECYRNSGIQILWKIVDGKNRTAIFLSSLHQRIRTKQSDAQRDANEPQRGSTPKPSWTAPLLDSHNGVSVESD